MSDDKDKDGMPDAVESYFASNWKALAAAAILGMLFGGASGKLAESIWPGNPYSAFIAGSQCESVAAGCDKTLLEYKLCVAKADDPNECE